MRRQHEGASRISAGHGDGQRSCPDRCRRQRIYVGFDILRNRWRSVSSWARRRGAPSRGDRADATSLSRTEQCMSNWKTLDQFEAQLREDPAFRAKLDKAEPEYLLAREILAARLAANMSQAALARAIGTSQSRVSKWERGEETPRVDAVRRIAKATGRQLEVRLVA